MVGSRKTLHAVLGCLLVLPISVLPRDVCRGDFDPSDLSFIHQSATPKNGKDAGTYFKDSHANSEAKCLESCCDRADCNIALYANKTCFLIICNKTAPEGCTPVTRSSPKFQDYTLMVIRDWVDKVDPRGQSTPDSLLDPSTFPSTSHDYTDLLKSECDPKQDDCGQHAYCHLELSEETIGFVCRCKEGYHRVSSSGGCVAEMLSEQAATQGLVRPADLSCEYGVVTECLDHEECVPKNQRAKTGTCHCVSGYQRNDETRWCEKLAQGPGERASATGNKKDPENQPKTTTMASTVSANPISTKFETTEVSKSTVTPTPSTTAKSTVHPLVVSVGDNKQLQLPKDDVSLSAYVSPTDEKGEYNYEWSMLERPDGSQDGVMTGIHKPTLKLSKLVAGTYMLKVAVTAEGKYGEGFVNVTVLPPARENQAPVVKIRPPSQEIIEGNDAVLDGSGSTDDDKIVQFHWDMETGPIGTKAFSEEDASKNTLVIKNLGAGKYRFKLTVTDSDGASNSTYANVTIIKEKDYPPKADAGSNVLISLPENSVILRGNASTDDKGIQSYEWIKKSDDKLALDMSGVRTPFLHLDHLEVGDYVFTLKVTDTAGQTDEADVHVIVKQEQNKPPVAKVPATKTVKLPATTVVLDGSNSTDDVKVVSYAWKQISGPSTATIENADRAVATATGLVVGEYNFQLVVTDEEKKEGRATIKVTVRADTNAAPKAVAGEDQQVTMPVGLVTLDGSGSSDDKGIVSYKWTRDDSSLAAGRIVNNSDSQAILQLTNLVAGRYMFTLKVVDAEGLSSTDSTSLVVKPDEHQMDLVELKLDNELKSFTYGRQKTIEKQLSLLLHKSSTEGDAVIHTQSLSQDQSSGRVVLQFYAEVKSKDAHLVQDGTEVVQRLKKKFKAESDLLDVRVISVDTVVCQNNCSGHGHCHDYTKQCICEAFWMENFFKAYLGDMESNCDWSILYVILILFVLVISIAGCIWGLICLCKRWYRQRPRKRHRYTLLQAADDERDASMELLQKGKYHNQGNSIMVSESDFSSDEETLFIQKKSKTKANGHLKNGMVKPPRSKVKT